MKWLIKNMGLCSLAFFVFIAGNKVAAAIYHVHTAISASTNAVSLMTECRAADARAGIPPQARAPITREAMNEAKRAMTPAPIKLASVRK